METVSLSLDRAALVDRFRAGRARSAALFASIAPSAYYDAPIPLRHPFVFYDGHLPAFAFLVLHERALHGAPVDERLEKLFERGIDPSSIDAASRHRRNDWPDRSDVRRFGEACDAAVIDDIAHATLDDPSNPLLVGAEALFNILEHEPMHHETLSYIINRLPLDAKRGPAIEVRDLLPKPRAPIAIAAGSATLGLRRGEAFGWDNEFEEHVVDVAAFGVDAYDVTNGDYLAFVRDGAAPPPFWFERDGQWWLSCTYGEIPLPLSWPVYASHDAAEAFAAWSGARLPTEAEYHRAAFGTPAGDERAFPWGSLAPAAQHGNFDFRRFDPEPAGSSPAGASAWGVEDLIGNGWEWTSTPFAPFDGFVPMASYPQYSADFFDGRHYVMKGASPVTATALIRRSFRNWFFADYPYMYATFRRVYD
ncbi:MAG TPA: SUMF1/EgtB/PvdO family nonheme iron enzyme [Candidatus Lustribacter sp.]|nr:SUMF1/EgtB/PvdO family nonheme iron enzyme [Candidatus Lustribacter sp.]